MYRRNAKSHNDNSAVKAHSLECFSAHNASGSAGMHLIHPAPFPPMISTVRLRRIAVVGLPLSFVLGDRDNTRVNLELLSMPYQPR